MTSPTLKATIADLLATADWYKRQRALEIEEDRLVRQRLLSTVEALTSRVADLEKAAKP